MPRQVELVPGTWVGGDRPTFFIAEGGINHNGSLEAAKDLISKAKQVCIMGKTQGIVPQL